MNKFFKAVIPLTVALACLCSCGNKKADETNNVNQTSYYNEAANYTNVPTEPTTAQVANNKIDVSEIVSSVKFENFNGYGYARVYRLGGALTNRIDEDTMKNFVAGVAPKLAAVKYTQGSKYFFEDIVYFVPVEDYHRLSNGDTVTIVAKITPDFSEYGVTIAQVKEYFGIDFDETATYTVEGLLEGGTPIDLISGISQYVVKSQDSTEERYLLKLPDNYTYSNSGFTFSAYGLWNDGLAISYNGERLGTIRTKVETEGDTIKLQLEIPSMTESKMLEKGYFLADKYVLLPKQA